MEKNALVSVIIPVYNVRPYLEEALDSVINQTYTNLEIIVIDDGSTDGSGEICELYAQKDARIRVIHQENKGLSSARNKGLDVMKGSMVAFLDSDDAYLPDYLSEMVSAMIREKADLVLCRFIICNTIERMRTTGYGEGHPRIAEGSYDRASVIRAVADGKLNVNVWNRLYRQELWQDIRFPDGKVFEDNIATLLIFDVCNALYVIEEPLYLYRQRPGSITKIMSQANISDLIWTYTKILELYAGRFPDVITSADLKRINSRWLNTVIRAYISYCGNMQPYNYEKSFSEWCRKQILSGVKTADIYGFGHRTMTAYMMLRFCPWLLKPAYAIYYPARKMIKDITGI